MKTIRLLGILVVLILLVSTINDFIPGFIDGWNAADNIPVPGAESYTFSVHPTEDAATDSIFNEALQRKVPAQIKEVKSFIKSNTVLSFLSIPASLIALLALYGYYCLARMLISVSKGEILTQKNSRRLRFFIYPMITLSAIFELLNYISYSQAIHELAYTGYEFSNFSLKYPWTELFIIVLLIEIFVQVVKIKEEQDLTI